MSDKRFALLIDSDNISAKYIDSILDEMTRHGVAIGRLREDSIFDWKFVGLAHNTLRGAAGGALECAEMLKALGYISAK